MKTWKKWLIGVGAVLLSAAIVMICLEYSYVARYNRNKKALTFSVDAYTGHGQLKVMSTNLRCDTVLDVGKKAGSTAPI